MRVIFQLALLIVVTLSWFAISRGQSKQYANQQDEHIRQVIESLDKYNELRMALEDGYRGDGIHHSWMDDMRKLGIKHVSFIFRFFWDQGVLKLTVSEVIYLQKYYQFEVTDPVALRQIADSGLRDKLEVEARQRATSEIQASIKQFEPKTLACGTVSEILFDDEALPILNAMTRIDIDSECIPKKECQNQR